MSDEKMKKEVVEDLEVDGVELPLEEETGDEEVAEVGHEKELEEALADAAEQKDKVLRIAAEFENYKKRIMREKSTAVKYAGEPILREILATVDNLERAISQGESEGIEAKSALDSLLEGVRLTLKVLNGTLGKFEVSSLTSVGEAFDPTNHEALTMEPSDSVPANHVINEFEKGYQYKDRLLRAAKVIVSSGDKK